MSKRKHRRQPKHRARSSLLSKRLFFLIIALLVVMVGAYYYFAQQNVTLPPISPAYSPSSTPLPTHSILPLKPAARPEIVKIDSTKKQVAFTFDAGEGEGSTAEILAALKKHHIKGTFFLVGKWIEKHPEITRQLVAEGHEIFNHSYSHPYFTQLTAEEIAIELQKMDDIVFATAGIHTKPYYRAPYGDRNAAVNDAAFAAGYQHIYWSVDSLDWRPEDTPETVKARTLNNIHPGAIVLMHVGNSSTGPVIDEIFTTLEEQGYKLVSLTEGL
jgi:peptidoglycan-N-acetylglucosamine deacetylase